MNISRSLSFAKKKKKFNEPADIEEAQKKSKVKSANIKIKRHTSKTLTHIFMRAKYAANKVR